VPYANLTAIGSAGEAYVAKAEQDFGSDVVAETLLTIYEEPLSRGSG
jgi:hypothetical protein